MAPVEERLAKPFYSKMMGLNALNNADRLWGNLVPAGQSATLAEVQQLLAPDHWRPVVMGAWFSLKFSALEVGTDLLGAIDRSRGTLTAPPLSVAACLLMGRDAAPSLMGYVERDGAQEYGGAGFIIAASQFVGGSPAGEVTERDREAFRDLLNLAHRFRSALMGQESPPLI